MSKKSQQHIVEAYLLHRECVRRNAEYAEAYHQSHAITDSDDHEIELVMLAERWGLSISEALPDPSIRPGYDPKQLMTDGQLSRSRLQEGPMQTDPIEMDAALIVQEHLSTALSTLSQELKGFLVLLHCPDTTDQPWGFDVIDLRRPKEEIIAGVQQLIDDARDQHAFRSRNKRRQSVGGPKMKGFDYLTVYDLRQTGWTFERIAHEMWGRDASSTKASQYFRRANAMIETPRLLRMVKQQLAQRRQKRTFPQIQSLPSRPLLWGRRAWLRPDPLSRRRSA